MRTRHWGKFLRRDRKGAKPGVRSVIGLALALGLVAPCVLGQKPSPRPSPSPSPSPSPGPTQPPGGTPTNGSTIPPTSSVRPYEERVMFLHGSLATPDGSTIPHDMLVERVCNERVQQQVYAGPGGDFSMQLGARAEAIVDASADVDIRESGGNKDTTQGIPRRQLQMCELRTSAAGFRQSVARLMEMNVMSGTVDVGRITVERATKANRGTLNAAAYRAPKEAVKAYEKGMSAQIEGKSAEAKREFEKAVRIYPEYAVAWYEIGLLRRKENDRDGAKAAFTEATAKDKKYLAPYLALTEMAFAAKDWPEVVRLTEHIISLDPMGKTNVTGYVLDLDPVNAGEAYFYNAMANYQLGKIDVAEKNALKAEHVDLMTHFPQLHLLLAEIFSEKGNYAGAIGELETYMELVPGAKDTEPLRTRLAKLEELNEKSGTEKRQ